MTWASGNCARPDSGHHERMVPATCCREPRHPTITDNAPASNRDPHLHGAIARRSSPPALAITRGESVIYDPGFVNTAACRSAITDIHADTGVLLHRGYRIEELVEHSTYLELAYLLIQGELPTSVEYDRWLQEIATRKFVHENVKSFMEGFRYDAHPMTMLASSVSALVHLLCRRGRRSHEEASGSRSCGSSPSSRRWWRGRFATAPARHTSARPGELSYLGNLLSMLFRMTELRYEPDPGKSGHSTCC